MGRLVAGAGTARPPPGGTARGTTQRRPVRFEPSVFVRVPRTLTERRLAGPTNRPRIEGDVAFAGQPRVARVTVAPRAHRAEGVIAENAIVAIARARVAAVVRVESVTRRGSTPRARHDVGRRDRPSMNTTLAAAGSPTSRLIRSVPFRIRSSQRIAFSFRRSFARVFWIFVKREQNWPPGRGYPLPSRVSKARRVGSSDGDLRVIRASSARVSRVQVARPRASEAVSHVGRVQPIVPAEFSGDPRKGGICRARGGRSAPWRARRSRYGAAPHAHRSVRRPRAPGARTPRARTRPPSRPQALDTRYRPPDASARLRRSRR